MLRGLIFLSLALLLASLSLTAQITDSTGRDVIKAAPQEAIDLLLEAPGPKVYEPRKALLWSLIPSGGQVYNERWWKVPLVFGAFSGMVAVLDFNQSNYNRFNTAYDLALAGDSHEFTGIIDDDASLRVFRDNFNRRRQTNYFALLGIYALQSLEAFVDAQLRDFDIDEDLSRIEVIPAVVPGGIGEAPAVVLQINYAF